VRVRGEEKERRGREAYEERYDKAAVTFGLLVEYSIAERSTVE
jgi:hypothetical protein